MLPQAIDVLIDKNYIGSLEGLDIPKTYSIEASSDRDLLIFANAYI